MSAMSPPWNAGHNPHIQKFMARKAPKPIEPRKVVHKAETETICAYPKGDSLTQTVILCAAPSEGSNTQRSRRAAPTAAANPAPFGASCFDSVLCFAGRT